MQFYFTYVELDMAQILNRFYFENSWPSKNIYDLLLGIIFMFDGVNLDHLHSSILSADIEALKEAQSKLKLQHFPLDNIEVKRNFVLLFFCF